MCWGGEGGRGIYRKLSAMSDITVQRYTEIGTKKCPLNLATWRLLMTLVRIVLVHDLTTSLQPLCNKATIINSIAQT